MRKLTCAVGFFLVASSGAIAQTRDLQATLSSGEQRVALIELFTSEGCSSCPPADRWLSARQAEPGLWKDYVPVAFHVDYWDYIGWEDRFARAEYSARQRQYVAEGGANGVYTPGVFLQGIAWPSWRKGKPIITDGARVGNLSARLEDGVVAIQFNEPRPAPGQLIAHVALLGMNLDTAVRSGENRNQKLHHDFVALNVVSLPLDNTASGYTANTPLPDIAADANELALAVWVSERGTQKPIQSVGGLLNRR